MKRSYVLLLALLVIVTVLVLLLWFFVFKTKTSHDSHHVSLLPENFVSSRATRHGSPDGKGNPKGACGYRELGRDINNGEVSAVSSRLWKSGTGCGACYQVRCKVPTHCNDEGVHVVATDYGEGDRTDFILSPKAYERMARPGKEGQLNSFGVVDVEYRRVPCRYASGHNLVYEVQEKSNPHYLALLILYVGGVNDILAVEVCQGDCKEWQRMRSAFGAVHDLQNPPRGSLSLRLLVNGTTGTNWVQSPNALPADWTAGATYNSSILLT